MAAASFKRISTIMLAVCILGLFGCHCHDQVVIVDHAGHHERQLMSSLEPNCRGYHSTCWLPWSEYCPGCPPPGGFGAQPPPASGPQVPTPALPEEVVPMQLSAEEAFSPEEPADINGMAAPADIQETHDAPQSTSALRPRAAQTQVLFRR